MSESVFFHAAAASWGVGDVLTLEGPEGHHAADVLRLRVGETVLVTDGQGARVQGSVLAAQRGEVRVEVRSTGHDEPAHPRLTVVQALPKGERGELAVELLTEIGVDRIVPWQAERCVSRWHGGRAERGRRKWERASVAAAKQSRRTWWPVVDPVADTAGVVSALRSCELVWVLHEAGATPLAELLDTAAQGVSSVALVVGPEGGLTPSELAAMEEAGAAVARLGPTVLRTSTAGLVGATLVLGRSAGWRRRVQG